MVKSALHTKIEYVETRRMDSEDKAHDSVVYLCDILSDEVFYHMTLGKEHNDFSHFGVYFYPIYLISEKRKVRGKVGVYEILSRNRIDLRDKDGDIDILKLGKPLLFSHVTKEYLDKYGFRAPDDSDSDSDSDSGSDLDNESLQETETQTTDNKPTDNDSVEDTVDNDDDDGSDHDCDEEDEEDEDELLALPKSKYASKSKSKNSKKTANGDNTDSNENEKLTKDNLFTEMDEPEFASEEANYPEETKDTAKKIRDSYEPSKNSSQNWISQNMKNPNYRILKSPGDGNCFFHSVQKAYAYIGQDTTIPKLRKLVSQEIDITQVQEYRTLYLDLAKEKNNLSTELEQNTQQYQDLKRSQANPSVDRKQARKIVDMSNRNRIEKDSIQVQQTTNTENLRHFAFMKAILYDTTTDEKRSQHRMLDKYTDYVRSDDFWADSWAISTLERLLNIKFLILQNSDEEHRIMRCTIREDDDSKYKNYEPTHYILRDYAMGGNHYDLVTYNKRAMFTFTELPYDLKVKVILTCLEKQAGPFAYIKDFRQFKHDIGIVEEDDEDDAGAQDGLDALDALDELDDTGDSVQKPSREKPYDEKPALQFYEKSALGVAPGKGKGDIASNGSTDGILQDGYFTELLGFLKGQTKEEADERKHWRRMLDDSWSKYQFEVDNKLWASVEHYMLALRFKTGHPEVYHAFSLSDKSSEIARHLDKAEASLKLHKGKEGEYYKIKRKTKDIDPDTKHEEHLQAVRAKFTQNADLTTLLASTKRAKLQKYVPKNPPELAHHLMHVRHEILAK